MIGKKLCASIFALTSVVALSITPVYAAEQKAEAEEPVKKQKVENAFTQCGIGAALFPKNEGLALLSNIIWDLGTTAVSSQTTSQDACAGNLTTAAIFIDHTYPVLEEQFVKGEGANIAALMDIMDCAEPSRQSIVAQIQDGLASSFADANFTQSTSLDKAKNMAIIIDGATASCNA